MENTEVVKRTFVNIILNTDTGMLFTELLHATSWEHAKKLFWNEHSRNHFRLLSTVEVPENTRVEFRLNDLRQFEKP